MRNRSSAFAITDNTKKKMNQEIGITKDMKEEEKQEKITLYLEEKLKLDDKLQTKTIKNDFHIGLTPPQYLDIKKDYKSKDEKVRRRFINALTQYIKMIFSLN